MLFARGGLLGDTVQVNVTRPAEAAPRPGSVSTGDTGPAFSIQQHHWSQIVREFLPGYPDPAAAYQIDSAHKGALRAIAAGLPPCPTDGVTGNGKECYYGWTYEDQTGEYEWGLLAPGTFSQYGVTFGINEMSNARFTKSFIPTAWQRRQLEVRVIIDSQRVLFGTDGIRTGDGPNEWFKAGSPRPLIGSGMIAAALRKKYGALAFASADVAGIYGDRASVNDVLQLVPDIALYFINFERNPLQPSEAEKTSVGGWKSWIMRGGYPLLNPLVHAQRSIGPDRATIGFPASIHCQCPITGMPNAMPGALGKAGPIAQGSDSELAMWKTFLSIPQDPREPMWTLTLVGHDDASWIRDVGKYGEKILTFLGRLYCDSGVQAIVQQNMSSKVAEQCAETTTGKPCKKGQPNCKCFSPPAYTQASVAASNGVQAWLCKGFMHDTEAPPQLTPPSPFPDPNDYPTGSKIPWWAVVGGGLLIGGALFARK